LLFHQASIKTGCLGFQVIEQQKFGEIQNHHEVFKDNFDKNIDPLQVKVWVAQHFSATRQFWWLPRRMTVCVQLSTKIVFVLKKTSGKWRVGPFRDGVRLTAEKCFKIHSLKLT